MVLKDWKAIHEMRDNKENITYKSKIIPALTVGVYQLNSHNAKRFEKDWRVIIRSGYSSWAKEIDAKDFTNKSQAIKFANSFMRKH